MQIQFLGAAHEVTGSCTLIEACGKKILIDCGMEQGEDIYENCEIPIAPANIDYLLLTHAHIDHSGKIPALTAAGFKGGIFATSATVKLCSIMLLDSAHIQEFEAKWRNRRAQRSGKELYVPLYTTEDAQKSLKQFNACEYNKSYTLCNGIDISFTDAGHLLGSASISIKINENGIEKTVVFSGDLGNTDRPLICDPQTPPQADILIIESTYGNRVHGERPDYKTQLAKIINETFARGGNVVIPSFAVGRTQEILYLIRQIKEQKLVKNHGDFPVYVDSPLAVEATEIFSGDMHEFYDEETLRLIEDGINPIKFNSLKLSVTSEDSTLINADRQPKIILSASGMCEAGRIRHHLKHNLWRPESTILFVGYQAMGTPGRRIVDGADTVKLFGEEIKIRAHIETLTGISGHADMNILLSWIQGIQKKPEKIFVNHGNDAVCDEFAKTVTERLGIPAEAPFNGAIYDLVTGECIESGNNLRKQRKASGESKYRESTAFVRLAAAGKRLISVIENYRHAANKDIAKFADQIIALCNKWDK